MPAKRQVEIFSAGCPVCKETIDLVNEIACPSCEISILDMQDKAIARRAQSLGIKSVPAVLINGELAGCCVGRGVDKDALRRSGVGQPIG